jgi:excisionase family DNA binding protein
VTSLHLQLTDELVDTIANRAAALVLERLDGSMPASEFLTVEEAAEVLRCKPQRIYDMRSDGRLSRFGDGSRALVSRRELVAHTLPSAAQHSFRRAVPR